MHRESRCIARPRQGGQTVASEPREFDVVVERHAGGDYFAWVPSLHGCHTQAASLDELMARIEVAIELCLALKAQGGSAVDFVGIRRVRLAS